MHHPVIYRNAKLLYRTVAYPAIPYVLTQNDEAAKLSRQCTARYGKVSLCTLLYACFAYQPSVQRQILHVDVKYSTVLTSKSGF